MLDSANLRALKLGTAASLEAAYGCGSKPFWHHFGVGAPPILVCFSGDWDVHWGYGVLTHGHAIG